MQGLFVLIDECRAILFNNRDYISSHWGNHIMASREQKELRYVYQKIMLASDQEIARIISSPAFQLTALARARQVMISRMNAIEQAGQQRVPLSMVERRRLELLATVEVGAVLLGINTEDLKP